MARLCVRCDGQEHTFELGDEAVVVGRAAENTIQIRDIKASRKHCQFEKTPAGYKVIDLESANGTEVNGKKANHAILKHGDCVTIGAVEIRFDDPASAPAPAPAPAHEAAPSAPLAQVGRLDTPSSKIPTPRPIASPVPPIVPAGAAAAAPDAETRTGRRALKPAALTHEEKERRVFAQLKTAAIVLVILGVLVFAGKSWMDDHARQEAAEQAFKAAWELDQKGLLADAGAAYRAYLVEYPGSTHVAEAKEKVAKIDERLATNLSVERDLAAIQVKLTSDLADLTGLRAELAQLATKAPRGPVAEKVSFAISEIELRLTKRGEAEFTAMTARAKKAAADKDFGSALDEVKRFLAAYPGSKFGTRAQEQLDALLRAAADDYEALVVEANKLLRERKYEAARKLLAGRADCYAGTRHQFEIQFKLYGIDLLARGAEDRVLDAKLRDLRRECYDLAVKADDLAKQRKYEEARAAYDKILARLDVPELADLKSLFERRKKDLYGEADLFLKLCKAINDGGLKPPTYNLTDEVAGTMQNAGAEGFEVKFANGGTHIPWLNLSPAQMLVLYRRLELAANDVYYLAVFSFTNRLGKDAHQLLYDFSKAAPERMADVYSCVAWGRGMEVPSDGFVWHKDQWLTKNELKYALLEDQVEGLVGKVGRNDERVVADAFAEYGKLVAQADLTAEFKSSTTARMLEAFEKKREGNVTGLKNALKATGYEQLCALKRELNKRRDEALKYIFDEVLYPYDAATNNHGEKGQPTVDKAVSAVKELWQRPGDLVARLNKNVTAAIDQIKLADSYVTKLGGKAMADGEELDRIVAQASGDIDLRNVALDSKEQSVLDYNKKVWAFNKNAKFEMPGPAMRNIEIVNEYREMMGLRILEAHDQCGAAARLHSEWMASTTVFSHDEDKADTRTPGDRLKKQGFAGPAGENIAMGMSDPKSAFDAWYHSSGHHRNMLMAGKRGSAEGWTCMGVGVSGNYWTQDFGAGALQATKGEPVKPPTLGGGNQPPAGGGPAQPPAGGGGGAKAPPAGGGNNGGGGAKPPREGSGSGKK